MLQLAATHAATMNNREAAIRCGNTESRQADWPCLPPLYVALGLLAVVGCSQAARSGTAESEALAFHLCSSGTLAASCVRASSLLLRSIPGVRGGSFLSRTAPAPRAYPAGSPPNVLRPRKLGSRAQTHGHLMHRSVR
jgi:hypothetical protein